MKTYEKWSDVPAEVIIDLIDSIDSHGIYKQEKFSQHGISEEMIGFTYIAAGEGKHAIYTNHDGFVFSVDGLLGVSGFTVPGIICHELEIEVHDSHLRGRGAIFEAGANALREHFGVTAAS